MMSHHSCRAALTGAVRLVVWGHPAPAPSRRSGMARVVRGAALPVLLALALAACGSEPEPREVELRTARLSPAEVEGWARPALESGGQEITVRQVFTAQGPCRELDAALLPTYPGEYMLRVVAREAPRPCGDESPHIGYEALLRGLPPGSHQLRIVHVGADGRTLAETVFEHPIIVTGQPGQ